MAASETSFWYAPRNQSRLPARRSAANARAPNLTRPVEQLLRAQHEQRATEGHRTDEQRLLRAEAREVECELRSRHDDERGDAGESRLEHRLPAAAGGRHREQREETETADEHEESQDVPHVRADKPSGGVERVPLHVVPRDPAGPEALLLGVPEARDLLQLVAGLRDRAPVVDQRGAVDREPWRDHPQRERGHGHDDRKEGNPAERAHCLVRRWALGNVRAEEARPDDAPGLEPDHRIPADVDSYIYAVIGRDPREQHRPGTSGGSLAGGSDAQARQTQYAPRRVSTAGIVFAMIVMSSQIDQFSM